MTLLVAPQNNKMAIAIISPAHITETASRIIQVVQQQQQVLQQQEDHSLPFGKMYFSSSPNTSPAQQGECFHALGRVFILGYWHSV
jgi:hypothetical protein